MRRHLHAPSLFLALLVGVGCVAAPVDEVPPTVESGPTGATSLAPSPPTPGEEGPRNPSQTWVVLLGTGTPGAEPDRFGPSTAIVAGGNAYVIDAGPGVVRRAAAGAIVSGLPALQPATNATQATLPRIFADTVAHFQEQVVVRFDGDVVWIEVERGFVGLPSIVHLSFVFVADAEVVPGRGIGWVVLDGALKAVDGLSP